LAPSNTLGGDLVKAVMRPGSVKVVKSSSADVRNSVVVDRWTVLMLFVPVVEVVAEGFDANDPMFEEAVLFTGVV
jgi:hypothetical protein